MGITKDIIEAEFRTTGGSKVQKEMSEVQKNIALINNENEKLRVSKAKLEAQNKKGSAEWKKVNAQITENNKKLVANKGQLKVLQSQMKVTDMTTKQLKNNIFRLNKELDNTSKTVNRSRWDRLNKELKESQQQFDKLKGKTNSASKSMSSLKGVASTFLPVASVAGFITVVKSATTELFALTKQMQGDSVRSATVFGNELGYVEEEAAKVAAQMGLTNREFVASAAATADLLIPLGFTREESAKMSTELQGLSGALDEWTAGQHGAAQVSEILTKAMLGENEQLKQLGISIQMDSKEFKDLVKVKQEATGATTAQAKAMATLELITTKSADAQAAYNQEGNKLLRMQKSIRVGWQNMKESVIDYFKEDPVDKVRKEQVELNVLANKIFQANIKQEERVELINKMKALYPEYLGMIDAEKITNEELTLRLKDVNEEYANNIILMQEQQKVREQQEATDQKRKEAAEFEARLLRTQAKLGLKLQLTEELRGKTVDEQYQLLVKYVDKNKDLIENYDSIAVGMRVMNKNMADYKHTLKDVQSEEEQLNKIQEDKAKLLNALGVSEANPTTKSATTPATTTPTADPTTPDKVKLPTIKISEDDIEKEMAKLQDKEIEEYLKGVDRMRAIQEQYGLASAATVNEQALAEIRKLRDDKIITEQEYADAEKAIRENSLQEQIDRNLRYRMLQEENKLIELEAEELSYQERLAQEEIRYQEALSLEDQRYAIEVERAKGQKELLLELEIEHKDKLINVENTYTQRKADVIARQNAIEKGRLQIASAVADGIAQVVGEESALGKAALITKQGLALAAATIDLTRGLSATAAVGFPQNVPLIAAFIGQTAGFISTIKNATANTSSLGSRQEGGYAETGASDSEAKGIYHANEFIGNADSVRNPSVKQAYDIIDVAQKNGNISTLNLAQAMSAAVPGRQSGGYANESASSAPTTVNIPPELTEALIQNTQVMRKIQAEGVLGRWEWQTYKDGKQKMEDLEQDVGIS